MDSNRIHCILTLPDEATTWNLLEIDESLHVRKCKTVLHSRFHAVDSLFQVLDVAILCRWNLDSGFQSLVA